MALGVGDGTGVGLEVGVGAGSRGGAGDGMKVDVADGPTTGTDVCGASSFGSAVGDGSAGTVGAGLDGVTSVRRKDGDSATGVCVWTRVGARDTLVGGPCVAVFASASGVARALSASTVAATTASMVAEMFGVGAASRKTGSIVEEGKAGPSPAGSRVLRRQVP